MTLIIVSRFIKIFDISLSKPSNHFDGDGDESIILLWTLDGLNKKKVCNPHVKPLNIFCNLPKTLKKAICEKIEAINIQNRHKENILWKLKITHCWSIIKFYPVLFGLKKNQKKTINIQIR